MGKKAKTLTTETAESGAEKPQTQALLGNRGGEPDSHRQDGGGHRK